MVYSNLMV